MTSRLKKNRGLRGHVSAGHGRVGKHRKHPGGRGNAGAEHHHKINITKYHPGYIGKRGMRNFHLIKTSRFVSKINVDELWALLGEHRDFFNANTSQTPIVDLSRLGISRVLGRTREPIPGPIVVRARQFTKKAIEKIEAAGGKCEVLGLTPEACNVVGAK